jgi:hypothetical protein
MHVQEDFFRNKYRISGHFQRISNRQGSCWNASCGKMSEINIQIWEGTMFKRIAVMALFAAFISLAIPSDTFARNCNRRGGSRAGYGRTYYSPSRYQARSYYSTNRYYGRSYYNNSFGSGRAYYSSPYRYRGVAGNRYYGSRRSSTRDTILRIAAPAAVGAGVGALLGGKKGAVVGALFGGGGGAIYHLVRNRNRRY